MKCGVVFLRAGCTIPDGMNLGQERFCEKWMSVEALMPIALEAQIRNRGWHFIWLEDAYSCRGTGLTEAAAVTKAVARALGQVKSGFNAAELESVKVSKYPGFWIAKITLCARQIQEPAYLSLIDKITIRQLAPR